MNKLRTIALCCAGLWVSSNNCGKCLIQCGSAGMLLNIPTRPPLTHSLWSQTWTPPSCCTSDMDLQTWVGIGQPLSSGSGYLTSSHAPSVSSTSNGSQTCCWPLKNDFYRNKMDPPGIEQLLQKQGITGLAAILSLASKYSCADGPTWDVATLYATLSSGYHVYSPIA
eukprot:scaffold272782_cov83-Attheya_sp.AAC.1